MVAHIDADCFFVSVELLSRPELKGRPVLVCSRTDERGIVVSASYEARPKGIRAGMPVFKAKKLCPEGVFLSSNFEKYEAISFRLMTLLRSFSPDVEPYSIDEAFVDLAGLRLLYRTNFHGICEKIQKSVLQNLGITVSIGIANSKLLAKIASDFKKPKGLTVISNLERESFLKQIPMADIPGVGPNTETFLAKCGLKTAYDVSVYERLTERLGKRGADIQAELRGISRSKVSSRDALPKSFSHTATFPDFWSDRGNIFSFSLKLLLELTRRLREFELQARVFGFFLITKGFKVAGQKIQFETPTSLDRVFIESYNKMFGSIFRHNTVYRKSGFFIARFSGESPNQMSLFEKESRSEIDPIFDKIYKKYGSCGITRGALLVPVKRRFYP